MASVVSTEQPRTVKSARYYRPELDLLRFFAVAMVFQFHLFPSTKGTSIADNIFNAVHASGASGVCLFFLLSAFLISELLLREVESTGDVHIKAFYLRRILRIWPLFFFMLLLACLFTVIPPKVAISHWALVAFAFLAGNWYMVFHSPGSFIGPLWSVSVEEQFYLLWPTIVKKGGRKAIVAFSILFWCVAFITLLILGATGSIPQPGVWHNGLVQFQFFAIGALLALFLHHRVIKPKKIIRIVLFCAGMLAIAIANPVLHMISPVPTTHTFELVPTYLAADAGSVLLFLSFYGMTTPRWCDPLVYLGKISYGLYVFHIFVAYFVAAFLDAFASHLKHREMTLFIVSIPLTIGLAMLSYRFIESPFLRLKNRFTFIRSREV